jgi:anti-sigma regulatory factor (Ser/Thr protein kinase)
MERDKDMRAVTVHEVLDSTLEAVAHVETVAVEAARRVGFRGVSLDHISLATHETATNAVVHGNRYRREKKVFVAISITQERFKITIADEGDGFDPRHYLIRSRLSDCPAGRAGESIFPGPSWINITCEPAMQAAPRLRWSSIFVLR